MLNESERLYGFAKTHFVSQNTAETIFVKEIEIGNTLDLVWAQRRIKSFRCLDLFHFLKVTDIVAQFAPKRIFNGVGQIVQNTVKNGRFKLFEMMFRWFVGVETEDFQLMGKPFKP